MYEEFILPPEWHPQDAILITWPHQQSAWARMLNEVEETYFDLTSNLSHYQPIIIQTHSTINLERVLHQLALRNADISHCHFVAANSNDTWARDHGPITLVNNQTVKVLNFRFNGWGNKFAADLDNQLTQELVNSHVIDTVTTIPWVMEGGSIESDGNGTLLTTTQCNLNENRNGAVTRQAMTDQFKSWLGVEKVLWLTQGELDGDDTDAHIDTLARFAPNRTIIFQGCDNADSHYASLMGMKKELENATDKNGESYRLIELPLPTAKYAEDGHRLPATYANFLITNKLVLVPTYQDTADQKALSLIADAFPEHIVIGINALPLIEEHGSLHCITMQLPKGSVNFAADWMKV